MSSFNSSQRNHGLSILHLLDISLLPLFAIMAVAALSIPVLFHGHAVPRQDLLAKGLLSAHTYQLPPQFSHSIPMHMAKSSF